jgi:hypothetical protein
MHRITHYAGVKTSYTYDKQLLISGKQTNKGHNIVFIYCRYNMFLPKYSGITIRSDLS